MKKVFITKSDFPSSVIEILRKRYELVFNYHYPLNKSPSFLKDISGSHAIFCTHKDYINKSTLQAAGCQLKLVATASITYDHIDIDECKRRGILVTNVADVGAEANAEFIIGFLLSVGKRIIEGSRYVMRGKWKEWCLKSFRGYGLVGANIGFFGMGPIAIETLKRIRCFGVKNCFYHDRNNRTIQEAEQLGAKYLDFVDFMKASHFVIANCILNDSTKNTFNSATFNLMKNRAILICTGSEELVHLDNLYFALTNNLITAAGLEIIIPFTEKYDKFSTINKMVLCARIDNAEITTINEQAQFAAENIISVLEGGLPLAPVC